MRWAPDHGAWRAALSDTRVQRHLWEVWGQTGQVAGGRQGRPVRAWA